MGYQPDKNRYRTMEYRRCGRSGLRLPAISLGLWHNFGDTTLIEKAVNFYSVRSIWALRISTLPTTMARPPDRPNVILDVFCRRISCPGATS